MPLYPLDIPEGCFRQGSEYQSQGKWIDWGGQRFLPGRWYDMAGMRFFEKTRRPVGGWMRVVAAGAAIPVVDGPGRGMRAWRTNAGPRFLGIGTPNKLWIYNDDVLTDITPLFFTKGVADTVLGAGYGSGLYGGGAYGVSTDIGTRGAATMWSMDIWGDHLLAMATHDNVLYEWSLSLAAKAVKVTNAPTGVSVFVTTEQIAVVLGAGGIARSIAWSDVQNDTLWAAAASNLAGSHLLVTEGSPMRGLRVRNGALILTDLDAHLMTYVGPNQVYQFALLTVGCGLIGLNAVIDFADGNAVWMGAGKFHLFNGGAVVDLPCEVADYIFSNFNTTQAEKVYCTRNARFGEITWFYCSASSLVIDRSVTWNYLENHWAINGQPPRSCFVDSGAFATPLAVTTDGILYAHEDGFTADGVSRVGTVYAQTGPVEIGNGDQIIYVTQVIPDEVSPGDWQIFFATRFSPEGPVWDFGPYSLLPFTDVRLAGRQVAIKILNAADGDFRIGRFRFDGRPGGQR